MTSTTDSSKCDYASAPAELVHLNDQKCSLDHPTSQLNALPVALQHRPNQLGNMLSPIYTLPIEVLSRIFRQLIFSPHIPGYLYFWYRACISQAFVLGSVSVHFRQVALGTPQLWKRVPIYLPNPNTVGKSLLLLQHCMALTTGVNVSVLHLLNEEEAHSVIDTLLNSDTTFKIKGFTLEDSLQTSNVWTRKLEGSSFPMLDFLSIHRVPAQSLDFRAFELITRLELHGPCASRSLTVIAPPFLQYLTTFYVPQQTLISLLYQSPNLVECSATFPDYAWDDDTIFDKPLTLSHLKRSSFRRIRAITFSPQIPLMPSLESLELVLDNGAEFTGVILLCRNASATLTTLKLYIRYSIVQRDDLHQLWNIPVPNLRELELRCYEEPFLWAIETLTQRIDECSSAGLHYLPSLTSLILRFSSAVEPRRILDLLSKWKIGKSGDFYVEVKYTDQKLPDGSPELREELGSVVGTRRQIDIVWGDSKVKLLVRGTVTGDALQKAMVD
jgi:hypothetical protein